jgi:hypothetical protein
VLLVTSVLSKCRELVVTFPGGGKFFYWQSGVAAFLNQHYDLQATKLVGASAVSDPNPKPIFRGWRPGPESSFRRAD